MTTTLEISATELQVGDVIVAAAVVGPVMVWSDWSKERTVVTRLSGNIAYGSVGGMSDYCFFYHPSQIRCRVIRKPKRSDLVRLLGVDPDSRL